MNDLSDLWLMISDCRCTCGHQWQASRVRLLNGGTPTPDLEAKGKCVGYNVVPISTSHCHRCVPLQLGVGWTEPQWNSEPSSKPASKPTSRDLYE